MKIVNVLVLFFVLSTSALAFGKEILSCGVSVATPDAAKLEFVETTYGVKLVSEKFEAGDTGERNLKFFEFTLEGDGQRSIAFTLDKTQPTGNALLNVNFNVSNFEGTNDLQVMQEMRVDADSVLTSGNQEFRPRHVSSMMCIKEHGAKLCSGGFTNDTGDGILGLGSYYAYSVYCEPL